MASRTCIRVIGALAAVAMVGLAPRAEGRELKRRAVTITDRKDARVPTLHVAPAIATVIAFESNVRDASFVREQASLFHPLTRTARTVVVVPKRAVTRPVSLSVAMTDGTILSFALVTVPRVVDAQVDVTIALSAASDSPEALKGQVEDLEGKLEECRGNSDTVAVEKIAHLILAQGGDAPQAFETHAMRGTERESRLRVQAQRVYRMLKSTYVVLRVGNRDPRRKWVLGRAVVRLSGAGQDEVLQVQAQVTEMEELPPDKEERVIVAFQTPQGARPNQRIGVALVEKDGSRRVELTDLEL
jgi:hypothetical protein